MDTTVEGGLSVTVHLPQELTGDEPLPLRGSIFRSEHRAVRGSRLLSILWDGHPCTRPRLGDILAVLHGPPTLAR